MVAGGFNQRLTGGGEAARLIDCRQSLSIQSYCSGLQHAALIWGGALSVSNCVFLHPSVLCSPRFISFSLFFIQCTSFFSSSRTANHSFPLSLVSILANQHIPPCRMRAKPLRQMDDDEWWGKPRLSLSLFLYPSLSFSLSVLLFLFLCLSLCPLFHKVLLLFSLIRFWS